eukprot:TRINITY_DN51598_c0_g1_i1.p2 TRINITY_DN51598_c0_g1~~TRINITY_DN51598_c0_g1_i1.p2  ORF type:complete len:378 (+),score=134.23 TRINITY_DN51598_c0_g1_i1:81-1214(+)
MRVTFVLRCGARAWKTTVTPDAARDGGYLGSPVARRMWGIIGGNYTGQLTSYNTGEAHEDNPMVHTELVPYVLTSMAYETVGQEGAVSVVSPAGAGAESEGAPRAEWTLVAAVPRKSAHNKNLSSGSLCSLTFGSANPQIFRFFDQIKVRPYRSVMSGRAQQLTPGAAQNAVWSAHFRRHKMLWAHAKAKRREAEQAVGRIKVERSGRLLSKTDEEEDDDDLDVAGRISPADWTLYRIQPETAFLARPDGGMDRVPVIDIPPPDPLADVVQPWVTRLNFRRELLIKGASKVYSIQWLNCFAFHLDKQGLYLMGQAQPPADRQDDDPTILWEEYFLEWGPNMEFDQPRQLQGWWEEFLQQVPQHEDDRALFASPTHVP